MHFNYLKHSFLVFNRLFCYLKFLGRYVILLSAFHNCSGNFGLEGFVFFFLKILFIIFYTEGKGG